MTVMVFLEKTPIIYILQKNQTQLIHPYLQPTRKRSKKMLKEKLSFE